MRKILLAVSVLLLLPANLNAQAPFYQRKTITIVVGYLAGDGYDIWARLLAVHLARHIPGEPNIIVQNQPGAGSLIAANSVYNVAKPDGLTLGAIGPSIYLDQLTGKKEAQFDWAKFTWIGSTEKTPWLFYMRADTPYKTLDDIRKASDPPKCSATGTGTSGHFIPKLMEEAFGTKFQIVVGYKGGGEQDLALERGEVQCRALSVPTFFSREPFGTWRKNNLVRVLLQTGRSRDPRAKEVPTIFELMNQYKTPEATRKLVVGILASGDLGRPIVAPPAVPPDRVKLLREAFMKTMQDPVFLDDVKKKKLEADPSSGAEVEALAKEAVAQPREVVERMKKILEQ
ncbi:MAG TPA: tripartite tricarboxylate transporter substrate-binding protein [Candidatus Binatia bacterium]